TYFPWGEAKGSTNPQDTWSYATYWRDSVSGLDYANNRYYSNAYGRFMTPDPYSNSGRLNDPQSWNRYVYTRGDPISRYDPAGTDDGIPTFKVTGWDFGSLDDYWDYSSSINPGTYISCMSDPVCFGSHAQPAPSLSGPVLAAGLTVNTALYFAQAESLALQALGDPECSAVYNTTG